MIIQILGTGCAKCKSLEANAREAVDTLNLNAEVVKISDMDEIINFGVMITPALALDGEVQSSGKLLSVDQIVDILKTAQSE